jgi:hypothetical protein
MKTRVMRVLNVPGRVLLGPKKLLSGYARIVAQKDGSGRIESFDLASRTWLLAPESVTFSEIWSAPAVPILLWARIGEEF